MPRKSKKDTKEVETPMEMPLETAPQEVQVRLPGGGRERVVLETMETEETAPPPTPVKTRSEIAFGDNLINSFANNAKGREIEVVFAFDTTCSMTKYLEEVRSKLQETCTKLTADIPSIKIGIMAFGDYNCKNYVCKFQDLCSDTKQLVSWVATVEGTKGADAPEAYEFALRQARKISWTPGDHVNKAFVIIGDSIPHPRSFTSEKIYWRQEVQELVKQGVKIYGVFCNPVGKRAKPFYEEVSEMSGGAFLTLKHLTLVTDMFKAVCYREFGAEHLETYRAEVAQGGRMDDNMEDLFAQLKQGPNAKPQLGERSKEGWYLEKYDKQTVPTFLWKSDIGQWQKNPNAPLPKVNTPKPSATPATNTTTSTTSSSSKRKVDEADAVDPPAKKVKKSEEKEKKKEKAKKEAKNEKEEKKEKSEKKDKKEKEDKKEKKEKQEKKEKKTKKEKETPSSPKKSGAKKSKKEEKEEAEEEDKPKTPLTKGASIVVGTGEWKRDRYGRMASLHD